MASASSLALGSLAIFGLAMALGTLSSQAEGRAFFVFGDSLVDNGNNNYLATTARADSPPYGIDYPTRRPTGRFSNGFNIPDFISQQLGAESTLPYLSPELTGQKLLVGANFASAGIGILNDTGIQFVRNIIIINLLLDWEFDLQLNWITKGYKLQLLQSRGEERFLLFALQHHIHLVLVYKGKAPAAVLHDQTDSQMQPRKQSKTRYDIITYLVLICYINFKISLYSLIALPVFSIKHCCCLESIQIREAANLVSFIYHGGSVRLLLSDVPLLTEVSIEEVDWGVDSKRVVLPQLSCCLSQLEILMLNITPMTLDDDDFGPLQNHAFPILANLKHLELIVAAYYCWSLHHLSSFMKVSPYLQRLVLKGSRKIVGYRGRACAAKHVMYLMKNAVSLEKIVIDPVLNHSTDKRVEEVKEELFKHVDVVLCFGISSIQIRDANLVSFVYNGGFVNLDISNVPLLIEVSIFETDDDFELDTDIIKIVLGQLSRVVSQVEILRLDIDQPCYHMFKSQIYDKKYEFPVFVNLKHLELIVEADYRWLLHQLNSFIKASPYLQRLALKLQFQTWRCNAKLKKAAICPHHYLKVVEIVGYRGRRLAVTQVMHLIKSALHWRKLLLILFSVGCILREWKGYLQKSRRK
ncbi:hypothetical protein GBA52_018415 [Prunus armeniaca]|nr:hypothetical protein GBA52_018415 [Prunus armeniaca]